MYCMYNTPLTEQVLLLARIWTPVTLKNIAGRGACASRSGQTVLGNLSQYMGLHIVCNCTYSTCGALSTYYGADAGVCIVPTCLGLVRPYGTHKPQTSRPKHEGDGQK